eukprot:856713-Rhodomonas_salina.1
MDVSSHHAPQPPRWLVMGSGGREGQALEITQASPKSQNKPENQPPSQTPAHRAGEASTGHHGPEAVRTSADSIVSGFVTSGHPPLGVRVSWA